LSRLGLVAAKPWDLLGKSNDTASCELLDIVYFQIEALGVWLSPSGHYNTSIFRAMQSNMCLFCLKAGSIRRLIDIDDHFPVNMAEKHKRLRDFVP
jgi:hypothetical protein